ncbi:MAG: prephenate dehydratase [Dehalococcoidia bacterium]
MAKRIAYLGPPGTFTEEAALRYDPSAQILPFQSFAAVAAAVDSGMADEGVMAIENSLSGSVTETLDILIHESPLSIRRELVLPIEHHLLAPPGTQPEAVKVILSHPQALAQCRRFLERCFPKTEMVAALSTTAAVEEMLTRDGAAAIGTRRAAQIYGAHTLARSIQDQQANVTRFVVVAVEDHPPTGDDKTSLAFSFADDRPGLLVSVLQEFSGRNINLSKVETRPTKERLGEYIFLLDVAGHRTDPPVAEALEQARQKVSFFRVFGSYPRFR